jgi:hypothetical protein
LKDLQIDQVRHVFWLDGGHSMHLYIVVDCKTQDCGTVHVLMHLGKKGKTPAKVEYWMPYPLMIACPTCGGTYDYSDSEERDSGKRSFHLLQPVILIGSPRHLFKPNHLQNRPRKLEERRVRPQRIRRK